jgi:GNAT superfamily N-acetyltransferase
LNGVRRKTAVTGNLRIGFLADHPEVVPILARLFESEWSAYYGVGGPGNARQDLLFYSNRYELPVGLVAFVNLEPCGVAALKAESIATHKHLAPWVGGGMVAPQFRRNGIGARLIMSLEDMARSLGYQQMYAGTSTANTLLVREGWRFIELVQYNGEAVSIYEKAL